MFIICHMTYLQPRTPKKEPKMTFLTKDLQTLYVI